MLLDEHSWRRTGVDNSFVLSHRANPARDTKPMKVILIVGLV
jgi:hypothetical protein